jgi:phosphopantothenate-cysteine ligase
MVSIQYIYLKTLSNILVLGDDLILDVDENVKQRVRCEVECLHAVQKEQRYLCLSFETLAEYLASLRAVAEAMEPLGARGCLFLAAAVSDFYIPDDEVSP